MAAARPRAHAGAMTTLARSLLDTLYLTIALATSVVAFAVWIAGVTASLSLAVFIVGLPIFVLSAIAFRWTAELDRRNAALVLGRPLRGRYRPHGAGLIARLVATLRDPQTWKDLAWLVLHSVLGFAFGVAAVSLVASVAGLAVLPVWYWSLPDGVELGLWDVDTLWEAFASAPLAIPLALLTALLLRAMAAAHARLARALLA
jgi:Putative sensor